MRINGKRIYHVRYRNTVSYYLRLPDGFPEGNGPNGSLEQLYTNLIGVLWDVEHRNRYTRDELIETLRAIIRREAEGSTNVWANMPYLFAETGAGWKDPENTIPAPDEDHSDHIYSGVFMSEAVKSFSCISSSPMMSIRCLSPSIFGLIFSTRLRTVSASYLAPCL